MAYTTTYDEETGLWSVWNQEADRFVSRDSEPFTTHNESAAKSFADRLNRGVYHHGWDI